MTAVRPAPETFRSRLQPPADFDAFWAETRAATERVPLDPRLEPDTLRSTPDVSAYRVTYGSIDGLRIGGWYCTPRPEYLEPPYPGLLIMPGYISEPTLPRDWALAGYAAMGVAPRGKLGSNDCFNPGYPGLLTHNIVDRWTYAYRGFYADAARAVDVLLSRPEVDPARIGVHGGSQGGALTITTAALRPDEVTCGAAGAPFLCGMMEAIDLTESWPYRELADYLRAYPDRRRAVEETLAYFDVLSFARRVRCPIRLNLGLADDVCPPETGYALAHALGGPHELAAYPRCGHDAGAHWEGPLVAAFLAGLLHPVATAR